MYILQFDYTILLKKVKQSYYVIIIYYYIWHIYFFIYDI